MYLFIISLNENLFVLDLPRYSDGPGHHSYRSSTGHPINTGPGDGP